MAEEKRIVIGHCGRHLPGPEFRERSIIRGLVKIALGGGDNPHPRYTGPKLQWANPMFDLDHQLAQEIADRAMSVLRCNVNVMDSQGLIIGTGEAERLYTRHEGAQLVLANSRAVEIDSAAASSLRGVQEGVNLPLCLDDQVIGVIGVSGAPDDVRVHAELVKMTAEMLVAQRSDQKHRIWIQERRDGVLASLLLEGHPSQRVLAEAQRLGLKPDLARTAVLFELSAPAELEQTKQWLNRQGQDTWCINLHETSLVWCTPRPVQPALLEQLDTAGRKTARIMVGNPTIEARHLHKEVLQLSDLAAYAQEKLPGDRWLQLTAHRIPVAAWRFRSEAGFRELAKPYEALQNDESNNQLSKTLQAWFDHGGDVQACADALNIHRNTLRYRLQRVSEITGIDLSSPKGAAELYLSMTLAKV